jgi:hypothetical protein
VPFLGVAVSLGGVTGAEAGAEVITTTVAPTVVVIVACCC